MSEQVHELISLNEFAKRKGIAHSTLRYAIAKGRIQTTGQKIGASLLIDWTTEAPKWETNRSKPSEPYKVKGKKTASGEKSEERKAKIVAKMRRDWNKMEKHIGDSEVYETGQMGIDPSTSRFDDIPDIDGIQAPEGSVAYFQAKKLAVDALRNLNKLKQETAQLISVPDAINLYCDSMSQLSDAVQNIPAKLTNAIVATIRKSVDTWKTPPENLEAEIFRLLTIMCKEILNDVSERIKNSGQMTKDFIEENVTGK